MQDFHPAKRRMKNLIKKWNNISLIKRIICGLIIGLILGLVVPQASVISILGTMFVGLKIYYRFVYGR